ncbi:hypothetical protein J3R30DRAFT_3512082, partial [Lentinula aciculospora]
LHASTLLFLHCHFIHARLSRACQLIDRTTTLLFRLHASFYIALLFTHRIPTALLMDMNDSYCRSSWLRCETSLMVSYPI